MTETAVTHDLRRRSWGRSIEFLRRQDDGSWRVCIFLSARIKGGDEVLAQGKTGDLRYRIRGDVDRPIDPGDQHLATLEFIGHETP